MSGEAENIDDVPVVHDAADGATDAHSTTTPAPLDDVPPQNALPATTGGDRWIAVATVLAGVVIALLLPAIQTSRTPGATRSAQFDRQERQRQIEEAISHETSSSLAGDADLRR